MTLPTLLARLAEEPARAAILLDVDGTLAPIVGRPAAAAVPEPTRAQLRRLSNRYALVACISGRPGGDAERVVGVPGLVYAGEHGLELEPTAAAWEEPLRSFVASAGWPAEDKRLTASFHFRDAEDPDAAHAALEQVARRARAAGFRTRWGRMVLELAPPVDADKGTAVHRLLEQHGLARAVYAGDDTTDLDAFRALDGLELGVRIAVASDEAPPALLDAADVVVDGPKALAGILAEL